MTAHQKTIKVALAGAGAFGIKHLDGIQHIDGVQVVSLVSRELDKTRQTAALYGIGHVTTHLTDSLALAEVDAVILCTPTHLHAEQTLACLQAGKHVQVEIPLADTLAGAQAVADLAKTSGLVAMCGHTRRFNPSHQWLHHKIAAGEFNIQQMDVQTYFLRRSNINALGQARSWTDHLLWHHAAHTVDLFAYQCGSPIVKANAVQGPLHPGLGIAMDMSIQLQAANGVICTLSLSFNNDGPLGTFFRYIGDTGTPGALRRFVHRQRRKNRCLAGGGIDERHRAARPRVFCRHPRGPRAQCQRGPGVALLPGAAPA